VHLAKRFAVTIVGVALLLVGLAMMVLPGPGILFIVGALAVLATEYVWARKLLEKTRDKATQAQQAAVASPVRTGASLLFAAGMVALGILMLVLDDLTWPFWDRLLDSIWGGLTGGILVVMGLVLITTTVVTLRSARGEPSTYDREGDDWTGGSGATRYQQR
jgi:uncharacterized protein (TIGR02611 family)